MHSLIHVHYAESAGRRRVPDGARPTGTPRPHPPPGPVRGTLALVLATAARRVDAEAARRAVA